MKRRVASRVVYLCTAYRDAGAVTRYQVSQSERNSRFSHHKKNSKDYLPYLPSYHPSTPELLLLLLLQYSIVREKITMSIDGYHDCI